jgi:excisionase family DNA binding protein
MTATHILNSNEAARLLRISRKTLARMIKARVIPSVVIGRRRFFSHAHLSRWVAEGGAQPQAAIPTQEVQP